MSSEYAIQAQDLRKHFGDVQAVCGVSFEIPAGEIFGLLGPNGAGKSTTISMLSGLLVPSDGDAIIMGHSIRSEPGSAKALLVVSDPTLTIGPTVVQNMVTSLLDGVAGGGIALNTITSRQRANGITPDPAQIPNWVATYRTWYTEFQRNLFHHPESAALALVAPAEGETGTANPLQKMIGLVMSGQMIFFAFFTGAYSMMSILREDEEGTLARLFTTPTGHTAILAGKFLAVFVTVLLQGLVLMVAGRLAFGIDWGDPLVATVALTGQVIAAGGLGVLIIAFVKNSRPAGPVLGGVLCALGFLGGLMTVAVPNMPAILNTLADFTPQGWVLKGWRLVMSGQTLADMLVPFVVLVAMGTVMFAVGAVKFRKRFA
jgi:ABC-type Fe3+/spermidine/putrescine transport system ATPase subunit